MTETTRRVTDERAVKLNVSKEWCMRMAETEGDTVIGAGVPDAPKSAPTTLEEALADLERLNNIYIQACVGRSEFRKALRDRNKEVADLLARATAAEAACAKATAMVTASSEIAAEHHRMRKAAESREAESQRRHDERIAAQAQWDKEQQDAK